MPFSFLPQYPPFSSPSFCSAVAMTTAALHHSSAGDLGSCSCSESAPLTSIHNTLSANAVTEANEELSPYLSSQALRREKLPVLIFFSSFSRVGEGFGHLSALSTTVIAEVSPLCPAATQWLLFSFFLLPFSSLSFFLLLLLLSLLPSLPYLPDSVSFTAIELNGQHQHWNLWRFPQKGNKREDRGRAPGSPLPTSPASLRVFSSSCLPLFNRLVTFLMNWSSLREEGLLVSLEGEGRELVPYPSLQECEIWFENGEPLPHPLSLVSFLHLCLQTVSPPPSPAAQPPARPGLAPGLSAVPPHSWSGYGGHWFECCLYRHSANGRSTGKWFFSLKWCICQRAAL